MEEFEVTAKTIVRADNDVYAINRARKVLKNISTEPICGMSKIKLSVRKIRDTNTSLKDVIANMLKKELSIPEIRETLGLGREDEHNIMNIVGELEEEGVISLKRFMPIYREDGGLIHLAIYGR